MNREIKFRAWDKQYHTMSAVTLMMFDTNEIDCLANNGEPKQMEHFKIMQFTGLHDKNGKEIYEGDIVRISQCDGYDITDSEVKFSQGGFIVEADFGDYDQTTIGWAIEQLQGDYDNIEVIGNIHQNPELL